MKEEFDERVTDGEKWIQTTKPELLIVAITKRRKEEI